MADLNVRLKIRADSKENWESNNPVLLEHELGIELGATPDLNKVKLGDGSTVWNSLAYMYDLSSLKTELNEKIDAISKFKAVEVDEVPDANEADAGTVYFVRQNTSASTDKARLNLYKTVNIFDSDLSVPNPDLIITADEAGDFHIGDKIAYTNPETIKKFGYPDPAPQNLFIIKVTFEGEIDETFSGTITGKDPKPIEYSKFDGDNFMYWCLFGTTSEYTVKYKANSSAEEKEFKIKIDAELGSQTRTISAALPVSNYDEYLLLERSDGSKVMELIGSTTFKPADYVTTSALEERISAIDVGVKTIKAGENIRVSTGENGEVTISAVVENVNIPKYLGSDTIDVSTDDINNVIKVKENSLSDAHIKSLSVSKLTQTTGEKLILDCGTATNDIE